MEIGQLSVAAQRHRRGSPSKDTRPLIYEMPSWRAQSFPGEALFSRHVGAFSVDDPAGRLLIAVRAGLGTVPRRRQAMPCTVDVAGLPVVRYL